MFKLIYSINMHTFVYQFERSVIDHYERISLYTKSFCTEIRLHVYHFLWPRFSSMHLSQYFLIQSISIVKVRKKKFISKLRLYIHILRYILGWPKISSFGHTERNPKGCLLEMQLNILPYCIICYLLHFVFFLLI